MTTEPLLVFPDPPPPLLAQTLDLGGHTWKAVANASVAAQHEPADGWAGALVVAEEDPEGAFVVCRSLRKRDSAFTPSAWSESARRAADRSSPVDQRRSSVSGSGGISTSISFASRRMAVRSN